jgi:diguanylate cyclase (GGDEF)-like protein
MTTESASSSLLIVDDTPQNIDLLMSMLSLPGLQILAANNGEKALTLAARKQPDLILLDVMMPGIDGFETCRRLKAQAETAEIPVIFVTALGDDVAQGFEAGGADYIAKPVRADEVRARVHHHLERRRLMRELKVLNQQLEQRVQDRTKELIQVNRQLREEVNERRFMQDRLSYLATHDFVTRLYNRDALEEQTMNLLSDSNRLSGGACLVLLELARFRIVNEACGYIAGDELLRQVADMLGALCQPDDFIARLGGDRFALLCRRPSESVMPLAQRIKGVFEGFEFVWEGRTYRIDARLAVLPVHRDFVSFDQLMTKADEAAYLLRRDGGPSVRLHQVAAHEADTRDSVNWGYRLMDALKHHHFRVYFQRIQGLSDKAQPGLRFETLVRLWDPETQQVVAPVAFIGPAERYQLIDQIDRWMLREVLTRLSAWGSVMTQLSQVSVNISAYSLRDPQLAEHVIGLLHQLGFPANKLCIEITESEAIVNLSAAKTFMDALKAQGARFALDDFGTGFASFGYLKQLPFDTVKIDGAFVRDMDTDHANAAMVASMVQMADALSLPVVAEFVERQSLADQLRTLGVAYAQGFVFHRPEEMTEAALIAASQVKPALQ